MAECVISDVWWAKQRMVIICERNKEEIEILIPLKAIFENLITLDGGVIETKYIFVSETGFSWGDGLSPLFFLY